MKKILTSACLCGHRVRYDGKAMTCEESIFKKWGDEGRLVPFCPEIMGGLPVPRGEAQRRGDVVLTRSGDDVTAEFICGAKKALEMAKSLDIAFILLKHKSPSCGSTKIYDGTFSGVLIDGQGVTAEILSKAGYKIFDETRLQEAEIYLKNIEKNLG